VIRTEKECTRHLYLQPNVLERAASIGHRWNWDYFDLKAADKRNVILHNRDAAREAVLVLPAARISAFDVCCCFFPWPAGNCLREITKIEKQPQAKYKDAGIAEPNAAIGELNLRKFIVVLGRE
jgi:hypothetical protein